MTRTPPGLWRDHGSKTLGTSTEPVMIAGRWPSLPLGTEIKCSHLAEALVNRPVVPIVISRMAPRGKGLLYASRRWEGRQVPHNRGGTNHVQATCDRGSGCGGGLERFDRAGAMRLRCGGKLRTDVYTSYYTPSVAYYAPATQVAYYAPAESYVSYYAPACTSCARQPARRVPRRPARRAPRRLARRVPRRRTRRTTPRPCRRTRMRRTTLQRTRTRRTTPRRTRPIMARRTCRANRCGMSCGP